jgi:hypothetical protein
MAKVADQRPALGRHLSRRRLLLDRVNATSAAKDPQIARLLPDAFLIAGTRLASSAGMTVAIAFLTL